MTRQNTAAGWTWQNPNSASYPANVLIGALADKQTLIKEVAAWEQSRKNKHVKTDWQFTIADARVKLKRLFPAI